MSPKTPFGLGGPSG